MNYHYFKDIIYPVVDLFIKLIIGAFIAIYLYRKEKRDKIKGSVVELFQNIVDELNSIRDYLFNYHLQGLIDAYSPLKYTIGYNSRHHTEQNLKNNDGIAYQLDYPVNSIITITLQNVLKYLSKLEILLGCKQYNKTIQGLERDIQLFHLDGMIYDVGEERCEDTSKKIYKHYDHYKEEILTKGEYMNKVFEEIAPLIEEKNKKIQELWNKLIFPHLKRFRQTIHKI